jgi:RHS repeat-associated protein
MTSPRRLFSTVILGLALSCLASVVHAQYPGYLTNSNDTGLPSYGSYISSSIDTVNLANGGIILRIPLNTIKDRNASLSTGFQYDSKFWSVLRSYYPYPQMPQNTTVFGWAPNSGSWQSTTGWHSYSEGTGAAYYDWNEQIWTCTPNTDQWGNQYPATTKVIRSNYVIIDETGAKHQVPVRAMYETYSYQNLHWCSDDWAASPMQAKAESDSGHWQLDITNQTYSSPWAGVIRSFNGALVNSGQVDTNGNSCCSLPGLTFASQSGQCAINNPNFNCTYSYTYTDSNGHTQTITASWIGLSVQSSFPTGNCGISTYAACEFANYTSSQLPIQVISKITLANGLSYTFSYVDPATGQNNPYGEIMQITLPTGGYIRYKWSTLAQRDVGPMEPPGAQALGSPVYLDSRVLSERHVSEDGVHENVWTYAYSGSPSSVQSTTVTDPLGNAELHTFNGIGVDTRTAESDVVYYQGSSTQLKKVHTDWVADVAPITINQPQMDPNTGLYPTWLDSTNRNPRIIRTTTTLLDSNQVTKSETDFNDCYTYNIFPSGTQIANYPFTNTFTECRAIPSETREYDFGSGSAGALLRKTDFTYYHQSHSTYLNAHMWTLVATKIVKDGSGNVVAQTNITYDSTSLTSTGGVALLHDYTNYSTSNTLRGNPTVISRWLNTNNSWLTTTNNYNDLGQLVQSTDPGGHTYNLSYADNFTDGVNRHSFIYLTSVISPTTNGISHVEGKQYYWYTGLTAAVCGQNAPSPASCANSYTPSSGSPVSDYAKYTYDGLGRPATVTHGDGWTTSFTFTEPANPSSSSRISVSATSAIDSATNLTNAAIIDGLGRVIQTQLTSDPDGTDYVDAVYDAVGRVSTGSNPHRGSSATTDGTSSTVYDRFGRSLMLIPPDGSSSSNNVTTTYFGNTVTVTDQAGKQRRSFTDGLGRLIEVDAPGAPPSGSNVTASNGYLVISGTDQTGGGAAGHGTVTISGTEQTAQGDPPCLQYDDQGNCIRWGQPPTIYDTGVVQITVNGRAESVSYGAGSTATNIAAALASAFTNDTSAVVNGSANGTVLTLTARTHGVSTDYSISATSWTNDTTDFYGPSFGGSPSGSALTGGVNDTIDTGTVSVTVGGVNSSVNYASGSTSPSIATALASAINGNSTMPVTASASGSTVNFTEKTQGSAPSLTAGTTTNYSSIFAQPSFSATPFGGALNVSNTAAPKSILTPAVTLYFYDTLNNLTCVEQHGNATAQTGCSSAASNDATSAWRIRRYTYNSLGQVLTAKNPESGTITYTYDSEGKLSTKVAPAPNQTGSSTVTTTITYDALHRVLTKTFSDSTPSVTLAYDGATISGCSPTLIAANPIGRRTAMCDAPGWEAWSYDSRGDVVAERRNTNGVTKSTSYTYNLKGGVTSITYPSGRTISYTYNAAGQTTSASDVANGITYASNAHYAAPGHLSSLQESGSNLIYTMYYNNRLQPCRISVKSSGTAPASCTDTTNIGNILDLTYSFTNSTENNGTVASITNNRNTARSQSFTYDELNRVSTAQSQATSGTYAWGLSFTYDPWANLLGASVTQGSAQMLSVSVNGKNQVTNSGFAFDAAGNMTADGTNTYTFNAEAELAAAAGVTYFYDADGRRVKKSSGKLYWYGMSSDPLSESDSSGNLTAEYIFMGGARIAMLNLPAATVSYYVQDHLGSSRVVTDSSGNLQDDSDFLPFGQEKSYASASGNHYKFTGKERDTESGLDDFAARFYASSYGRFISADDSKYSKATDPQTLNLYTYVSNNPINAVDPTGHYGGPPGRVSMKDNFGDGDSAGTGEREQGMSEYQDGLDYVNWCMNNNSNCSAAEGVSSEVIPSSTTSDDIKPNTTASSSDSGKDQSADGQGGENDGGEEDSGGMPGGPSPDPDPQNPPQQTQQPSQQKSPYQKWIDEQNKPVTDEQRYRALREGVLGSEPGVKMALVISAPNFAVMGAAVLADLGFGEAITDMAQGVKAAAQQAPGAAANAERQVGVWAERYMPGTTGVKEATDFVRGLTSSNPPPSPGALAGWAFKQLIKTFLK